VSGVPDSPFKGLAAFEDSELDALLFFGREREIEAVATNVLASRLTVLYGPSGVGKSSLLRAGVARRLRELGGAPVVVHDSWAEDPEGGLIASVRAECGELGPTAGLVDTVAAAAQQSGEIHLLLDQFEEYVLYHGAWAGSVGGQAADARPEDRAAFGSAGGPLTAALPELLRRPGLRVNVLLAIRDDALAELDEFTGRIPELFANLFRLERLGREEGRAAILGPLARYSELTGTEFTAEDALVEAVLDEATTEEGVEGPYLQLVLERLWEHEREDGSRELRLSTFQRIGGSRAVVDEHVQGALAQLGAAEQERAAGVMRQLVTPSGRKLSHEAADLAEYANVEPAQLRDLLEELGRRRIVRAVNGTPGAPTRYEIFHDVLGPPIVAWQNEHQLLAEREQARKQRRRLRVIVGASLGALVVVAALAIYALVQRSDARTQAQRAFGRELAARAVAELPSNPATSVEFALRAARLAPGAGTASVLRSSLLAMDEETIVRLGGNIVAATFSPNCRRLLIASSNGKLVLYNTATGHLQHLDAHEPLTTAIWGLNGRVFVSGSTRGNVIVWGSPGNEVQTGAPITSLAYVGKTLLVASGVDVRLEDELTGRKKTIRFPAAVETAALSPNGNVFAVAFRQGRSTSGELVSADTGRVISRLPEKGIRSFAFSPNGKLLASGTRIWDARTGRLFHVLPHKGHVYAESFSPDGTELVTSSSDGGAYVWDVASGQRKLLLIGATGGIEAAVFSPDGSEIATGSDDHLARIYDSSNGHLLSPLSGHEGTVTSVGFDPSGRTLITASTDGTARLWDALPVGRLTTIDTRTSAVQALWLGQNPVSIAGTAARILTTSGRVLRTLVLPEPITAFATDGQALAIAGGGHLETARPTGSVAHYATYPVTALAYAGTTLLVGHANGSVTDRSGHDMVGVHGPVLGLSTGGGRFLVRAAKQLRVYTGYATLVSTIHTKADHATLSPDGSEVATAKGAVAQLWDAKTGKLLHTLTGHSLPITDVEYSPDGRELVTVSLDHTGLVWAAGSGHLIHRLGGHFNPVYSGDYNPDGHWIVTASQFAAGLWNSGNGQLLFYLGRHEAPLTGATFSPKGDWILTGSQDGTARVYHCEVCAPLGRLESLAARRLRRLVSR
jgi:WD40 repeat protein